MIGPRRVVLPIILVHALVLSPVAASEPQPGAATPADARADAAAVSDYCGAVAMLPATLATLRSKAPAMAERAAELCKAVEATAGQPAGGTIPAPLEAAARQLEDEYGGGRIGLRLGVTSGETPGASSDAAIQIVIEEIDNPVESAAKQLLIIAAGVRGDIDRRAERLRQFVSGCGSQPADRAACDAARQALALLGNVDQNRIFQRGLFSDTDAGRVEVLRRDPGDVLAEVRTLWQRTTGAYDKGQACLRSWHARRFDALAEDFKARLAAIAAGSGPAADHACAAACQRTYEDTLAAAGQRLKGSGWSWSSCDTPWNTTANACVTAWMACDGKCGVYDDACKRPCAQALQPCCHANAVGNAAHTRDLCLQACPK